ncbi:MAG: Threonine dehydratase, catabolic [uncultured Corynebacteriales bacterium]|uniref:Threonine dehydratase, catabolic n=1 Tax=uncultured Mycobacteriales bacterium TaxID=581187 RepID=A0A6J4JCC8_9ACTN|nr:MAG: Threonine dehydratase, catabolic [uncultured Corynebacteriales bacterium]
MTAALTEALLGLPEVLAAADRIAGHTARTPLLRVPGTDLWVKPENQQPTGSFKVRGAVSAVSRVAGAAVVAQSSGNHGQALAYAGSRFGVPVTVVVPDTVPAPKAAAMRRLGAALVVVPPAERDRACRRLAAGAVLVAADAPDVLAGQATVGLEILAALPSVDTVLVPVGNGGLLAGVAAVVKAVDPRVRVVGVEPELAGDAAESFRRGERVAWPVERTYRTVADGLRLPSLGASAWPYVRRWVDDIVTVTEAQIVDSVDRLLDLGLAAEPSGAVAAAAWRGGTGTTVAILSGGNVSAGTYRRLLAAARR